MKRYAKIITIIICAAVLAGTALQVAAEEIQPLYVNVESVINEDDGMLYVLFNTNAEDIPQPDELKVTLGNTELPVDDVLTIGETNANTSYVFLVDVSGSIKQEQLQAIKDTITIICLGMEDGDNAAVFEIGTQLYTQPFTDKIDELAEQIEAIEGRKEHTNLYESIFTSLAILETHAGSREKKVLVVFSDGEEYNAQGITLEEALIMIQETRIPVFTVAMLGKNPASKYVETAKILGSFARLSAGGSHYVHTLDPEENFGIALDILTNVYSGLIAEIDLTGFESDGSDMTLRLELSIEGLGSANDSIVISTAGLSNPATPDPTPDPTEEPTPDPAPPPATPSDTLPPQSTPGTSGVSRSNIILFAGIGGGGLVLLIIIIIIIIVMRRKNTAAAIPPTGYVPDMAQPVPLTNQPVPVSAPPPGKPRISLRLTKIGLVEEQVYRKEFAGTLTLGRNASKCDLSFTGDDRLSGCHCSISYEPEGIVIRDLGSTNKTFVNGVPIKDRYILENDDIILIGSMELRVNWETL